MNKFANKPWYNFLNVNDLTEKEILPLRTIGQQAECQRCFILTQITSELDAKLTTFVCSKCRLDNQEWDYKKRMNGISISIQSMVMEQPDSHYTNAQSGEGRN